MTTLVSALAVALSLAVGSVHAHGDTSHPKRAFDPRLAEQKPFGIAGDPAKATRTIEVTMSDRMHFLPSVLTVRRGETVRFVVRNAGKLVHEMVIGTEEELREHAELMRQFPDMEHDEPHMVHVSPGKSGDLVWTFNQQGEFHFACLVGGHYEAGMRGRIVVR